jgi:KGK domain
MNNEFQPLEKGEMLSIVYEPFGYQLGWQVTVFPESQIMVEQFTELLKRKVNLSDNQSQVLVDEGINCQALKFGSHGWQKGKLRARVILEFCPDEPVIKTNDEFSNETI